MDDRAIDRLERVMKLRAAGWQLHEGEELDPGWLAVQLWDFADLLDWLERESAFYEISQRLHKEEWRRRHGDKTSAEVADEILREVGFYEEGEEQ